MFGLDANGVEQIREDYQPEAILKTSDELREVVTLIRSNHFCAWQPGLHDEVVDAVLSPLDPWLTAADFPSYIEAQRAAAAAFKDASRWTKMSILNSARSGRFSTDRTMRDYDKEIWHLTPNNH